MKISVGKLASLEPGDFEGIRRVDIPPAPIGVAEVGGRLFAFDSRCPHRAADLTSFGEIAGERSIRCGVHGHVYDLETGGCSDARECDPKLERLVTFEAEVERGTLWLEIPDDDEQLEIVCDGEEVSP